MRKVDVHQFAMVPRADIPRSSFRIQTTHKTTFDAGYLIPVYVDEVLPGDSYSVSMTAFARMATPLVPVMDNMMMESFFFFVPNRLTWSNWRQFMGQQTNPTDSIDFSVPRVTSPTGGFAVNTLYDYMGLPTVGQVAAGQTVSVNCLPLRAYNTIWNAWFRDENLQDSVPQIQNDGPAANTDFVLLRRGKRHDYFTSCLPWVQKGASVLLPLGTSAPVKTSVSRQVTGAQEAVNFAVASTGNFDVASKPAAILATTGAFGSMTGTVSGHIATYPTNLYADLSTATAATINQIRQSFQIQKLLERDARGGTRYTEIVRSHFGVISPDARQQRPEYLGGGSSPVVFHEVAQTSNTPVTGTPQGNLAATGRLHAHGHGFTASFTEHGYVLGLVSIRADLSYQQGIRRMWTRSTRYDFYWPVFAMLGEQAVTTREIYSTGNAANDDIVFGYQERWAEYRYNPSLITGLFRSTAAGTLDVWHLAQRFTSAPTLNSTFIQDTPPVDRVLAVTAQTGKQFLFDSFFDVRAARPMPMYSVPGLVDHF